MAMRLKRAVCLKPQEHYWDIFRKWYCIAMPLATNGEKIIGYLDISTIDKKIADEMTIVIKLLSEKIINEYEEKMKEKEIEKIKMDLKGKPIEILQLQAKGYKEIVIAKFLKIKPITVKYHKKKIMEKLTKNTRSYSKSC